jgi:hypothetical protein
MTDDTCFCTRTSARGNGHLSSTSLLFLIVFCQLCPRISPNQDLLQSRNLTQTLTLRLVFWMCPVRIWAGHRLSWLRFSVVFVRSSMINVRVLRQIWPRPLPSILSIYTLSFIHHPSIRSLCCEMLTALINRLDCNRIFLSIPMRNWYILCSVLLLLLVYFRSVMLLIVCGRRADGNKVHRHTFPGFYDGVCWNDSVLG